MNINHPEASELVERNPWYLCLLTDRLQLVRLTGTFILSLWMAWFVGAEDFGFIQSSLIMAAILSTLTALGIEGSVREDFAKKPAEATAILGTSMVLRGIAGVIGFAALYFLAPSDPGLKPIWLVLGLLPITQTPLVMTWWLEHSPSRRLARFAKLASFVFTAVFLACLIRRGAASVWFAAAIVFEQPVFAILVFGAHLKLAPYEDRFTWDPQLARSWLRASWKPLGFALIPFAIVPLNQLLSLLLSSSEENGQFAVAMVCYSFALFVLQAILKGRRTNRSVERNGAYTTVEAPAGIECYDAAKLGWLLALITAGVSSGLIFLFLNAEYHRAIWVVLPLSFSLVPTAIGWVRDERLIRAQRVREMIKIQLTGAGLNLIVAAVCIHFFGAIGAAAATAFAAIVTNLMATHRSSEAPRLSRAQWRALILATTWQKRSTHSAPVGGTITPFPLTNA